MLTAYILDTGNNPVGVLDSNFDWVATKSATIDKVSFYQGTVHLFVTEFPRRFVQRNDNVHVTFDSGIGFYYLITKTKELIRSPHEQIMLYRGLRKIVRKIKHERKTRNELNTWNPQIYSVLFNEKQ